MEAVATKKLAPTVVAHAVTCSGRQVLIHAEGPGTTRLERVIARRNSRRWNEGKRTWLL